VNTVTLYDIRTGKVVARMDRASAERELQTWRDLGIPLREHDTTDRQGRRLRVVFQGHGCETAGFELGGMYEFLI
jgi:hypothetical protein